MTSLFQTRPSSFAFRARGTSRVSKKKTLLAIITIYAVAGAMAFIAFSVSRSASASADAKVFRTTR